MAGNSDAASWAEISSIGSPNVLAHPACRRSSCIRSSDDASRSDPTSCHPGACPVSASSDRYRSTDRIIILVRDSDPRSCPTSPAEWNVDPLVSSARSSRTTSLHPRRDSQYATEAPPTPPPMTTARADVLMSPLLESTPLGRVSLGLRHHDRRVLV